MENGIDAPSDKIRETRELIESIRHDLNLRTAIDDKTILSIKGKIRYIRGLNRGAAQSLSKRLDRVLHYAT